MPTGTLPAIGRAMTAYPVHEFHRNQPDWPLLSPSLSDFKNLPLRRFFAQGSDRALSLLTALPLGALAIVGTRRPSARAVQFVHETVSDIARSNRELIIISGLARGIDSAAHEAALRCGLPTIAILGCGLDQQYPPENEDLRRRILREDGLLISEYEYGSLPLARQFLERNRLIAAWSNGVWVAEAGYRSGALNTAGWARDFEKALFATPAFPGDPAFAGNERLLGEWLPRVDPVFGASSFGHLWIPLSTARKKVPAPIHQLRSADPIARLVEQVHLEHRSRGGVTRNELFDWALGNGGPQWTSAEFFHLLQAALETRQIIDENGLLLKNLLSSD